MNAQNKSITKRDVDFAKWYTDVVRAAHLCDYTSVKGCMAIEPNGYAIWEKMKEILDNKFKELGHVNVSMPLLIPENLLKKESELVEGFAPEVAWVTEGGSKKLDERLCIRPTSETLFCDYYKTHVTSHRDLPMLYNQWCNVLRWEKETRPFLRSREFLWQEGHTIHATRKEAEEETKKMADVYKWFFHEILAIPSISGLKTEKEKFAGAEYTITNEDLMYNGVCLQDGTSHYFGQKFSKAYDVKFTNKENKDELLKNDITAYIDDSEKSPGFKFAEAEVNGIPIRIEVGKRDLENNKITFVRRDTREKIEKTLDVNVVDFTKELLETIQKDMYDRALERQNKLTFEAHNLEDMEKILNTQPGFIHAMWCGDEACETRIKEIKGCKSRCIVENGERIDDKCVCCGKEAKHHVIWGIQY